MLQKISFIEAFGQWGVGITHTAIEKCSTHVQIAVKKIWAEGMGRCFREFARSEITEGCPQRR